MQARWIDQSVGRQPCYMTINRNSNYQKNVSRYIVRERGEYIHFYYLISLYPVFPLLFLVCYDICGNLFFLKQGGIRCVCAPFFCNNSRGLNHFSYFFSILMVIVSFLFIVSCLFSYILRSYILQVVWKITFVKNWLISCRQIDNVLSWQLEIYGIWIHDVGNLKLVQ